MEKRFQITEPPTLRASYLFHPIRDIFTSFLFIGKKGGVFQQLIVVLCHLQPQRHMEITSFVPWWYDMHVPNLHTTTGTRGLSFQESFNEQCAASYSSCEVHLGNPDPSSSVKKSYKLGACVVWLSQFSCNTSISYWSASPFPIPLPPYVPGEAEDSCSAWGPTRVPASCWGLVRPRSSWPLGNEPGMEGQEDQSVGQSVFLTLPFNK